MVLYSNLKRASLLFLALSASLWGVIIYMPYEKEGCLTVQTEERESVENGAEFTQEENNLDEPVQWFHSQLQALDPINLNLHSSCLALNTSSRMLPNNLGQLDKGYFGTISVIGEVQLPLSNVNNMRLEKTWLKNISKMLSPDPGIVLTTLAVSLDKANLRPVILRDLKSLGDTVIVSLANSALSQQLTEGGDLRLTVRALDWSGVEWLGLHVKKHHILPMGPGERDRVGILAFCKVQKYCGDTSTPFSPVKYSLKLAKSSISVLNEHGVAVILVIMYWGLETSYFPDETSLSIARQLSRLGVHALLGYHPNVIQHHAYFGKMLVIFSSGRILSHNRYSHNCWKKTQEDWIFSSDKECETIHPRNREMLFLREHQSRIYKFYLSRTHPVLADYATLELTDISTENGQSYRRAVKASDLEWTSVCSHSDRYCLSCNQF